METRRYDSPLRARRAAETRANLIATATERFTRDGWANTSVRDIAAAAGVSVETVYKHFSSKRGLLDAVVDQAVTGDDEPVPVAGRPEFLAMGVGPRHRGLAAAASVAAAIHQRTAGFAKLIREAAASDPEIAEVLRLTRERQRTDVESGLSLILGRPPTSTERDGAWAILSPEAYLLLVEESAWSLDDYERWVAGALDGVLPDGSRRR